MRIRYDGQEGTPKKPKKNKRFKSKDLRRVLFEGCYIENSSIISRGDSGTLSENTSNNNVGGNYRRRKRFRSRKLSGDKKESLKSVSTSASSKEVSVTEKRDNPVNSTKRDFSKSNKKKKSKTSKNNETSKKQSIKKEDFKRSFIKKEFNKYKRVKSPSKNVSGKFKKEDLPYRTETLPMSVCPICNKQITNMMTALLDDSSENYAHFDCVYDKLKSKVTLKGNERLSYIGNGAFAIIEDYKDGQALKFKIKQQFQYSEPRSTK